MMFKVNVNKQELWKNFDQVEDFGDRLFNPHEYYYNR